MKLAKISMDTNTIREMTSQEKLKLIEQLWDSLLQNGDEIPVHEWQKQETDRRAENLAKNPGTGVSWDHVKAEIRKRYDG